MMFRQADLRVRRENKGIKKFFFPLSLIYTARIPKHDRLFVALSTLYKASNQNADKNLPDLSQHFIFYFYHT